MALESPLVPSNNIMSNYSPYTDFALSPGSPFPTYSPRFQTMSTQSFDSSSLRPSSMEDGLSPGAHLTSPSDMVGPSPVTSNGTESTDIDDEVADGIQEEVTTPPSVPGSMDSHVTLKRLSTSIVDQFRTSLDDESISVIHAPEGYKTFNNFHQQQHQQLQPPRRESPPLAPLISPRTTDRSTPTPYQQDEHLRATIRTDLMVPEDKPSPISPPPITTDIKPVKYGLENATPRAQTRQEVEALSNSSERTRSSSANSLEGIPEYEEDDFDSRTVHNQEQEISALKTALNECWTLCNTLASLSSIHRERLFSYSGTRDAHEKAWKCCWRLCQKLYDSRDEDHESHVRPTLDLCRDFCQALFDVRQRKVEVDDCVLRVSFELNNHLFNTHDRNLPEAFRERTLDFYITLCHRLMKQRNESAEETDALLRACWSLAEMLFSLRQNKREGKAPDEELLGSAVQACWELCDLFREGWTQVRPERGTPRASQTTFTQTSDQMSRSSKTNGISNHGLPSHGHTSHHSSLSSHSLASLPENPEHPEHARTRYQPETPTTVFEDTPISPEDNSPHIPNILVLGTEGSRASNARWSSTTSSLSGYSQGSNKSSSTITSATSPEDVNLTRLKVLILKAAMNVGFSRTTPTTAAPNKFDPPALQTFVKSLPAGSFGSLPAHSALLNAYRNLVLSDPTFRSAKSLPDMGKKVNAADVAKSVGWMMRSGQYTFLKDLFRLVFGFHVEEAEQRKNVTISV